MVASLSKSRNFTGLEESGGYPGADQYPETIHPEAASGPIKILKADMADLRAALVEGAQDWRACRTDVLVSVVVFPLAAVLLAGLILDRHLLPFIFPICSGVALLGPAATVWFAALSRQRELDGVATTDAAAAIFDSPRAGTIKRLAGILIGLFVLWLLAAGYIYSITLANAPAGKGFFGNLFTTAAGYEMIILGVVVGAVFALLALALALVGFQLALDREMSVGAVINTSFRVALANPVVTLAWGAVVVAGLAVGTIPALLGLRVTIPILGHASWHLYRRLVQAS